MATLGAHAVNYQFAPVSERVEEADVLIDLVGGDAALDALKCLKDGAKVVTVPTLTAELICEKAKLLGFEATGMLVDPNPEQLDALLYMVSVGLVKTEIQNRFIQRLKWSKRINRLKLGTREARFCLICNARSV